MKQYRDSYLAILQKLQGDKLGQRAALDYIAQSDIWVHGKPVPFSYIPHLFDASDRRFLGDVCKTTHAILTKIIARYLQDPEYRAIFNFSPELERLILLPCDYAELLPLARFDLFLDEQDRSFKFCEFNTDGSGAMSRDFEIGRALQQGATHQEFAKLFEVTQFDLFDSWVRAFISNYQECSYAKENPVVAITDFEESGVFSDFNRFIAAFEREGISARFVDVRSMEFDGTCLRDPSDGVVIDAIYRRAVTSEMLQHPGECDALIQAVAARRVCLIGHFRTTVVHSKIISVVLFDEKTRSFLTPQECAFIDAHVPHTFRLNRNENLDIEEIKRNKDSWIIKPEDDYGAHGVYPGVEMEFDVWESLIEQKLDQGYVVQEYYLPPTIELVEARVSDSEESCKIEAWQSMPGLYTYNGEFAGLYCREGRKGIIALDHGGLCSPSFKIDHVAQDDEG